jgi:hypothetical protein
MDSSSDFLALGEIDGGQLLKGWLAKLPPQRSDYAVLITLDGAALHHRHHPGQASHYHEFATKCRELLREAGGRVNTEPLMTGFDSVVCAWFTGDASNGIKAFAELRSHCFEANLEQPVAWIDQRYPLGGIGRTAYAAFRLLKLARRGQAIVDPKLWQKLPTPYRELAASVGVREMDIEEVKRTTARRVDENLREFWRNVDTAAEEQTETAVNKVTTSAS